MAPLIGQHCLFRLILFLCARSCMFCTFMQGVADWAVAQASLPSFESAAMSFGLNLAPQHRVYAGFAIYSFAMGNIFPRLPDIKHAMGIGDGTLGLSLIGTPIGTLTALTLATPLLERVGFRRALLVLVPLLALAYAVAVHAPGPLALFLMLFPVGLMIGSVEIMLNVEADRTEFLVKRRIMNRAHSFWSMGFFGAGLFGGALAHLGISPQLHLALIVPIVAISMALFLGGYQPAPSRFVGTGKKAPMLARPTLPILVLVAVTLSAMLMEGASIDWSAIYMRTVFRVRPLRRRFHRGAVRLFPGNHALLRRQFRRPLFAKRRGAGAAGNDGDRRAGCLFLARAVLLHTGLCASGDRYQRPLPAGDLGCRPTDGSTGCDQCRGTVADLLRRLPARPAAARLRLGPLGHPLGLWYRHSVHYPQPADRGIAWPAAGRRQTGRFGG
ncbi:MFS family permease [Mesorhizobium sp. USDA 4775]